MNNPPLGEAPPVSRFREVTERLAVLGEPALTYQQGAVILGLLERLYEAEDLLGEAKVQIDPSCPLADRVARHFARIVS